MERRMKLEYGDPVSWWELRLTSPDTVIGVSFPFRTKQEAKLFANEYKKEHLKRDSSSKYIENITQHTGLVQVVINYSPPAGHKLVCILCFTAGKELCIESKYLTKIGV